MTLRIISTCDQYCSHCMQNSGPKRKEIMSLDTFKKSIDFIFETNTDTVNISGGEPTLHPYLLDMLDYTLKKEVNCGRLITLITNGLIFTDEYLKRHGNDNPRALLWFLLRYKNFSAQITNVKGIYSKDIKYSEIEKNIKSILKEMADVDPSLGPHHKVPLKDNSFLNIHFVDKLENGITLAGRAIDNVDKLTKNNLTFVYPRRATKCFNLYNITKEFILNNEHAGTSRLTLFHVINYVKLRSKTSKCVPFIKENGGISFGEFDSCSEVANIHDENFTNISFDMLGPCGACIGNKTQHQSLLDNGLTSFKDSLSKIGESYLSKQTLLSEQKNNS